MSPAQVVETSVNNYYDSPCQDFLYPQDHTQTRFDTTSDHSRKLKSNNINEELALTSVNSSTLARFYIGVTVSLDRQKDLL